MGRRKETHEVNSGEAELEISSVAYGGIGISRTLGRVVMVEGVLPGEVVRASVVSEHKRYSRAALVSVIKPSPHRIPGDCTITSADGTGNMIATPGCVYQNFSYPEEVRVKHLQFRDFMKGISDAPGEPTPSPCHLHYRNKIILHARSEDGFPALGYREGKIHRVVDIPACPLAMTQINSALCEFRRKNSCRNYVPEGGTLTFRHSRDGGVLHWVNNPPRNSTWLREGTPLGLVSVPPGSFFQINPYVADSLMLKVKILLEALSPSSVIDLYCGCGFFSVAAAAAGITRISGLDGDPQAVQAARFNLHSRGIDDSNFCSSTAENGLEELIGNHRRAGNQLPETVVIVDPPRAGIPKAALDILAKSALKAIIYVSCSPDTLARDASYLLSSGFSPLHAEMLDMFPRTMHFESLLVLSRAN